MTNIPIIKLKSKDLERLAIWEMHKTVPGNIASISREDMEIYRQIVDKCPLRLVTEDSIIPVPEELAGLYDYVSSGRKYSSLSSLREVIYEYRKEKKLFDREGKYQLWAMVDSLSVVNIGAKIKVNDKMSVWARNILASIEYIDGIKIID